MARVITFSRTFPAYHPKKGQPTFFVEKILSSFVPNYDADENEYLSRYCEIMADLQLTGLKHVPKYHTVRSGNRWKVGDKFSPRVWSGKPYNSKQIQFAPDMEVKKIWNIVIENNNGQFLITKPPDKNGYQSMLLLRALKYTLSFFNPWYFIILN